MFLFSEKLLNEKIFKTSFPIKKAVFIFVAGRLLPFKRDSGPRNYGFAVFSENTSLFKKSITLDKLKFFSIIDEIELIDKNRSLSIFLTALFDYFLVQLFYPLSYDKIPLSRA